MQTNRHAEAIYPAYRGAPPPRPYHPATEDTTDYPESDGQPMAETELHRDLLIDSLLTLDARFQHIPDVCVSGNMLMYYTLGESRKSLAPDVFVTFGVARKQRRIYKIWEEGKPPDFVLEFSSKSTFENDLGAKKTLYAEVLGVREYFLYDAERKYLPAPLMGFRLVGSGYVAIRPEADGKVFSETLGLSLGLRGDSFGFYDPVALRWLETPMDAAAERVEAFETLAERAEAAAARATLAQQRAEADAEQARADAEQADARADEAFEELAQLKEAYRQLQIERDRQKSAEES